MECGWSDPLFRLHRQFDPGLGRAGSAKSPRLSRDKRRQEVREIQWDADRL